MSKEQDYITTCEKCLQAFNRLKKSISSFTRVKTHNRRILAYTLIGTDVSRAENSTLIVMA